MVPICLHCLNCTKFGQLILRKTIKIVATRGQILRLKCTKFDFTALPQTLSLRGLLLKEVERFYIGAGGGGHRPPNVGQPPPNILVPTAKIHIVKI